MDYEKKYKDALERARIWKNKSGMPKDRQGILDDIFPELKESEDEKIKETLIDYFKTYKKQEECGIKTFFGIPTDNIIAWLEKQGEKKVPSIDFKAKDCYVSEVDGKIHDMTYDAADKVEPKFKVGDWIVDNCNNVWQVVEVSNNFYRLKNINESESLPKIKWVNETFHLWSVKDVKDGDVLYSLDSKQPFIFKHRKPNEQAEAYCGLNIYGKFFVWGTKDCVITTDKYIPSTKEQRDALMKAMADAGYTFDFEKKELKKIKNKNPLLSDFFKAEYERGKADVQKSTWSDEDEENLQHCCGAVFAADYYTYDDKQELEKWLLQLKERLS